MWKCILVILIITIPGCIQPIEEEENMVLATTTSMRDSGLLDVLLPAFTESTGIKIDYVAAGTGAALNLGKSGDADLLIVHAPDAEVEFIQQGHGIERKTFAWNRFVILSPKNDPVGMTENLSESLVKIAESGQCFVSRGDNSGTHIKEQEMWNSIVEITDIEIITDEVGTHPVGEWYYSIGQGMGAAITMAYEKDCYTLSDKGTHLFRDEVGLVAHEFVDQLTLNPYSIILLDSKFSTESQLFFDYLFGEGTSVIENYSINNEQLFFVNQPDH
jgi:tungstate transport system substrate-binding protein